MVKISRPASSCSFTLSDPSTSSDMRQLCLFAFLGLFIVNTCATTAKEAKEAYLRDLERRIEHQVEKVAEKVGRKTAEAEAEEKAERVEKTIDERGPPEFDYEAVEWQFAGFDGGWKPSAGSSLGSVHSTSLYKDTAGTRGWHSGIIEDAENDDSGFGSLSSYEIFPSRKNKVALKQKIRTPLEVVRRVRAPGVKFLASYTVS